MLRVGKHKGKTFELATEDRKYAYWILSETTLSGSLKLFAKHLQKQHGGILIVGRYKRRYFDEVLRDDPGYCEWAMSLKDPGPLLQPFIAYLEKHFGKQNEEPVEKRKDEPVEEQKDESPKKKARADDNLCKICCDNEVNCCFVPCGHVACCLRCGLKFEDGKCPICQQNVFLVVQTFVA